MNRSAWKQHLLAAGLALALIAPAHAGVISFESATPGTFLTSSDSYAEGGFSFSVWGDFATIDTAAAFGNGTGLDLAAPRGNASQFVSVLNDSRLVMSRTDGSAFGLTGVEFGYISPLVGLFAPGDSAGQLLATYVTSNGLIGEAAWDFGLADGNGEFSFQSLNIGGVSNITAIAFGACAYDGAGSCIEASGGFSQFALDNIATVPEPNSGLLACLGIVTGLFARRFARKAA